MQQQALQQQATQFLDFYRTGLRSASDMLKLSLDSAERLQQQQFQAVRNALDENAKSVSQMTEAKSLEELIAAQSRMAGAQMETLIGLWTGMWRLAGESQAGMMRQAQGAAERRPQQFEAQREPQRKSA
jgi:phasin family protein